MSIYASKQLENMMINAVLKVADDCMKVNAENASKVGLETRVTRRYDGVGLSGGRVCQWCLDRCGDDVPYKEAVNMGMFQRHPGCGCELLYHTEKGTQRQTNWKHNVWEYEPDEKALEKRKNTGIRIQPSKSILEMRKNYNMGIGGLINDKR